jgi:hypothetical protein
MSFAKPSEAFMGLIRPSRGLIMPSMGPYVPYNALKVPCMGLMRFSRGSYI